MHSKNRANQYKILYLILIFLFTIFLIKLDFFKHLYSVVLKDYDKRMISIYGYCNKEAYGFLKDLDKKYKFKKNQKILNSNVLPNSSWVLFDSKKGFSDKPKIFLNYQKKPSLVFLPKDNKFQSTGHIQFTDNLESITFYSNKEIININSNIKVLKYKNNKEEVLFEKKFNQKIRDSENINIFFKSDKFNSRWENLFIEIENYSFESNKINSIKLNFLNKYNFTDEDIIFSKDNCYYIK